MISMKGFFSLNLFLCVTLKRAYFSEEKLGELGGSEERGRIKIYLPLTSLRK